MIYLSAEQLVALHAAAMAYGGGEAGASHRGDPLGAAEAVVQAVKNSYYATAYELGAAYAVYIVRGHVFLDGNKRTAALSLATFLRLNGAPLVASNAVLVRLMIDLAKRARGVAPTEDVVRWLAARAAAPTSGRAASATAARRARPRKRPRA